MGINGFLVKLKLECALSVKLLILMLKEMTNKEKRKEYDRLRYKANRKKILARSKAYNKANKDKIKVRSKTCRKAYRKANKEKLKACAKAYSKANKEKLRLRKKAYYEANKDKRKDHVEVYRKANKDKINAYLRIYEKEKRRTNPKFRLNNGISGAIRLSLKGNKNGRHWESLVGYTLDDLKKHLEKLFTVGMLWENYGLKGWTIDHKIPISVFNFTKPEHEDFKKCWALKNLQPMWHEDNLKKHSNLDKHFQPSLLF